MSPEGGGNGNAVPPVKDQQVDSEQPVVSTSSQSQSDQNVAAVDENVQLSMAPHVQTYLAQVAQESGCWGRYLPIPFERAAGRSWWDPTFDSEILEEQFKKSASAHNQAKFRYALWYLLLISLTWFIYFMATGLYTVNAHWPYLCAGLAFLALACATIIALTYSRFYMLHMLAVSLHVALALCACSLLLVLLLPSRLNTIELEHEADISPLGHFAVCTEILLLIYTVIPLRLYSSILIAVGYSILFEILTRVRHDSDYGPLTGCVRLLAHVCVHLIGVHILIMANVRMRNTFMKVGQSLLVRRQLESEQRLKENMIHSLMPPSVAQWLLTKDQHFARVGGGAGSEHRQSYDHEGHDDEEDEDDDDGNEEHRDEPSDIETLFRPFNMSRMENVSILFADIVGFTKISGSKTAEQLVEILNDLFQRFDLLCKQHNCEKISTLGDCYYCVSGCPEARPDHAQCCVEMGLAMIQGIKQFDVERNEGVNMRVGVHTGTILCGIVGMRRFKFDVWSNDVTLANRMESTGKPGMVHISETTAKFLENSYVLEEGEAVFGLKTFFILGRHNERPPSFNGSIKGARPTAHHPPANHNSLQLIVSPPTSPPSMSPQTRPRVLSCDTPSLLKPHQYGGSHHHHHHHHLHKPQPHNPNHLSPDVCKIKANSLPSILDSENEQVEVEAERESDADLDQVQTPTSTASSGRYSVKLKNWRMPRFLRKSSEGSATTAEKEAAAAAAAAIAPDFSSDGPSISNNDESSTTTVGNLAGYQQVPMIIETANSNGMIAQHDEPAMLLLPTSNSIGAPPMQSMERKVSNFVADEQGDTIDVKSYISQSRSDIGPYDYSVHSDFAQFIRTGSYRSQYGYPGKGDFFLSRAGSNRSSRRGKSPCNYDGIVPSERSRSATVNIFDRPHKKSSLDVPSTRLSIILVDDQLSTGPSVNSRKDSGIRSNSRRSSIQPLDSVLPVLPSASKSLNGAAVVPSLDVENHRVSGYYTSSQSSTLTTQHIMNLASTMTTTTSRLPGLFYGKCIQSLRKQSDRQLIRCVQDNSKSRSSYFMQPPLSPWTLFFKDAYVEREYREKVHEMYASDTTGIETLANSKYNTYVDVFVSVTVFTVLSLALFLLYRPTVLWIVYFAVGMLMQSAAVGLCFRRIVELSEYTFQTCVSRWYRWNVFGAVLVSLPLGAVLVNFRRLRHTASASEDVLAPWQDADDYLYCYLLLIGVIHFCNFTQLNCWMRNVLCTVFGAVFIIFILSSQNTTTSSPSHSASENTNTTAKNSTNTVGATTISSVDTTSIFYLFDLEILVNLGLLIVLVWGLNYKFEIYYRDGFHTNYVAQRDRAHVQSLKNQADWLIYNIVPEHVAEQLKQDAKYSENFHDAAIIFASIVNFNEMYDESYLGGKEFLRVLNELIGDFDELLTRPEFACVEKIKTIGSTFMAASGLNSNMRRKQADPHEHLYALMDFAIAMQNVISNFNRDLLGFDLILRIGYNFGDVTAAVIGKTKLYYDIWGDSVNIASRMDSTGVNGRIQVGEHCLPVLEHRYRFEQRGSVYVKGKDNMNVYMLSGKIDEHNEDDEHLLRE